MGSNRLMLVRVSVLLNVFLVMYLCVNWYSTSPVAGSYRDPSLQQRRSLEGFEESTIIDDKPGIFNFASNALISPIDGLKRIQSSLNNIADSNKESIKPIPSNVSAKDNSKAEVNNDNTKEADIREDLSDDPHLHEPPREVQESVGVTEHLVSAVIGTEAPDPPLDSLEKKSFSDLRDCPTKPQLYAHTQRGEYWVLENYIPAAMAFTCDESITYTTHGDYTFLDNLETLTSRWQGPVSIGVYAPGSDFEPAVNTIMYLRECWAEGIKKFVTFHLIYHTDHVPAQILSPDKLMQRKTDCSVDPPKWVNITTYRQKSKLLYPVNVARNVARRAATTYFVCASDIELYPSVNFIPDFFKMLKKPDFSNTTVPKVFVFTLFEVKETISPPETKPELLEMLAKKEAIAFHKQVCSKCHNIPHAADWLKSPVKPGLSILNVGKRLGVYKKWEPIYVGTNKEPYYDERLSWEGKSDKMTQMYILCVRDYEFLLLDNAFLVHRPGIKRLVKDSSRDKVVAAQNSLIRKHILPEYKVLFGSKPECVV